MGTRARRDCKETRLRFLKPESELEGPLAKTQMNRHCTKSVVNPEVDSYSMHSSASPVTPWGISADVRFKEIVVGVNFLFPIAAISSKGQAAWCCLV